MQKMHEETDYLFLQGISTILLQALLRFTTRHTG